MSICLDKVAKICLRRFLYVSLDVALLLDLFTFAVLRPQTGKECQGVG